MAQQQKMLLYLLPLIFAVSGVNFPIGVLIYWTTTNLWSMGQQFYVIRRNPTPGSEAERLLKERRARKAARKGVVLEDETPQVAVEEKPAGQRQQPKRKDRAKRQGQRPAGQQTTAGSAKAGSAEPASGASSNGTDASSGSASSGSSSGSATGDASGAGSSGKPSGGKAGGGTAASGSGKKKTSRGSGSQKRPPANS